MAYYFATGNNNTGGYSLITPQPACDGLVPGVVIEGLDGNSFEEGFTTAELVFSCATAEQAEALYNLFGLTTARSAACTISLPTNESESGGVRAFDDFNAIIHKPVIGKQGNYHYWWKNLTFRLTRIEVAA